MPAWSGSPPAWAPADGAQALVSSALDSWGRLDVVVNNAGIARDRMLVDLGESDWDDVVRVHLESTFLVTQRAAQHWRARSKEGEDLDIMAARYSSATRPRSRNGTPSTSNSRSAWPTPTDTRTRPPERTSRVAMAFASTTGWWYGRTMTAESTSMRDVAPAVRP